MNENNAPSAVRAAQRLAEPPAEWLDELLAEPHAAPPGLAGRILDHRRKADGRDCSAG